MDLNLLADLAALLREGSVTAAAKRLNITVPAMSRRLARLRDAVGDPLFVAAGRGLVPTERARVLGERIPALLEEINAVLLPDKVDFSRIERTFALRANDGFAGVWATRLAQHVAEKAPGIRLRFMPRADKSPQPLRDGLVDLDLGVLDNEVPELYAQRLFRAPFVGVVRAGHPILAAVVTAQSFASWEHISASRCGLDRGPIDDALEALGLRRKVSLVAPGFQTALAMVVASEHIAAMPEPFARWAARFYPVTQFALPVATPEVTVSQSWHPRQHADPVHRWLRELVLANCQRAD